MQDRDSVIDDLFDAIMFGVFVYVVFHTVLYVVESIKEIP